jgi:hypothetical protein
VDGDRAAVLDIGHDVGALVLYAPEALLGHEVEVESDGELATRVHTIVRERQIDGRRLFPAVFPALRAGRYRICPQGWGVGGMVTINGGVVAEVDWPT